MSHCNNCQALARAAWIETHQKDLPTDEYFPAVFTAPAEITARQTCVVLRLASDQLVTRIVAGTRGFVGFARI